MLKQIFGSYAAHWSWVQCLCLDRHRSRCRPTLNIIRRPNLVVIVISNAKSVLRTDISTNISRYSSLLRASLPKGFIPFILPVIIYCLLRTHGRRTVGKQVICFLPNSSRDLRGRPGIPSHPHVTLKICFRACTFPRHLWSVVEVVCMRDEGGGSGGVTVCCYYFFGIIRLKVRYSCPFELNK